MTANTRCLLALNQINGLGPKTILKCLARWPNLVELFNLSFVELLAVGFSESIAKRIYQFNLNIIDNDFYWQAKEPNRKIITWLDEDYPALLREIPSPPIVLYLKGDSSALHKLAIAIVGTRKPSISGHENARKFAFALGERGVVVVSGLALGVDTQAHIGCLDATGITIAVLGTGIDVIYPGRNVNLANKIGNNGLLISEFPLKTAPKAGHFPRRNRIISGLSLATLVVEAAIRSGSLITARFALEQNRDVFAIPGSIQNMQAQGCNYLVQQGAKLITSIDDILDELNLSSVTNISNEIVQKTVPKNKLTCENNSLVKYIGFELTSVDQIVVRSGKSLNDVVRDLAELELEGIVGAVPGGYMRYK
ncbi:MAG: DNA protecting protein DprA [Legionellales bacterium RIFCSPHIGHO2_12_FULL_35_11]|nr:MAG: DNA protecting protein DprA [Legionellales bacterium RIFCSPHIGHO2_12_FULL_35_11]